MTHFAGNYYHVYNRDCNRENIFLNEDNYLYLQSQASKFLIDSNVTIIAYRLMPNHYHFLLRSDSDNAVARFIQRLFNSYTQAFNRQHKRRGTLFEGRAKSILIDDESYLIQLCRYIHLNPVTATLVQHPNEWRFSNYPEWIGKGKAHTAIALLFNPITPKSMIMKDSSSHQFLNQSRENYQDTWQKKIKT